MATVIRLKLIYSQQQFLCLFTLFFVNILHVIDRTLPEITALKSRLGELLGKIRHDSQRSVAQRIRQARESAGLTVGKKAGRSDHTFISGIEKGTSNPTINVLLELIVVGLQLDFSVFCRDYLNQIEEERGGKPDPREMVVQEFRRLVISGDPETADAILKLLRKIAKKPTSKSKRR